MSDVGMEAVALPQQPAKTEAKQAPVPPAATETGQKNEASKVASAVEKHAGHHPITDPSQIKEPKEALVDVAGIPHPTVKDPTQRFKSLSNEDGADIVEGGYFGFHGDTLGKRLFDVGTQIQEGANFEGDKTQELLREALSRQFPQLTSAEGDIFLNVMGYMKETKPPQDVYGDIQWKLFEEQYRNLSPSLTDEQRFRVLSDFYTQYDPSKSTVSLFHINGDHISGNVLNPDIPHEREEIKTTYIAWKIRQQYNKGVIDGKEAANPEVRTLIETMAEEWKKGYSRSQVTNEQTLIVREETDQEFQTRALSGATHDLAEILKMGIDDAAQIDTVIPDDFSLTTITSRVGDIRQRLQLKKTDSNSLDPKVFSEQLTEDFVGDRWVSQDALKGLGKAFAILGQSNPNAEQAQQATRDIQTALGYRGWKRFTSEVRILFNSLFNQAANMPK